MKDKLELAAIGTVIVLSVTFIAILLWPATITGHSVRSFDLIDNCGLMTNFVSHTIPNAGVCNIRCHDQCEAKELELLEASFVHRDAGCHSCHCTCKKRGWFS